MVEERNYFILTTLHSLLLNSAEASLILFEMEIENRREAKLDRRGQNPEGNHQRKSLKICRIRG